jgi:hypothetical protein
VVYDFTANHELRTKKTAGFLHPPFSFSVVKNTNGKRKREDGITSTAKFEGTRLLKILAFEEEMCSDHSIQRSEVRTGVMLMWGRIL